MIKNKTIVGLVIATIVLAGVAVAVSAQGEGGVQPMAIMPGAITTDHLAGGAVTSAILGGNAVVAGKIATGAISDEADFGSEVVNSTAIKDYTVSESDMNVNAVNSSILQDNAVVAGKIATGAINESADFGSEVVNSTAIKDYTVNESDMNTEAVNASILKVNAIPNVMEYTTTALSTTNGTFNSSGWISPHWNTTIVLPRTANLSVAWTGMDVWVQTGGNLSVNCTIYNASGVIKTSYPSGDTDGIKVADSGYGNLSASVNFYATGLPADTYTISMQIKNSGDAATVGVNKQAIVATAYPA